MEESPFAVAPPVCPIEPSLPIATALFAVPLEFVPTEIVLLPVKAPVVLLVPLPAFVPTAMLLLTRPFEVSKRHT
jgi:hypothetical protein